MTKFRRRAAWAFFSLLGLLVLVALGLRAAGGWYLQSERFRRQITAEVNEVLKADGSFMPLHLADGTFYSDGFAARGTARAFFSDLRAEQIRAVVNWRGLLDRRWEIDELNIQNLDLRFAGRAPQETRATKSESPSLTSKGSWQLDLRQAEVAQSSWHWGTTPATSGSLTRGAFTLRPSDGSWLIEASSGTIAQTGWPNLSLDSAKLRYTGESLFVSESALRAGGGRLRLEGEIKFERAADFRAQLDHVSITPLLPPDWRVRLHGNLNGTAKIHAPLPSGDLRIEADLQLADGQLEALPLLDQIATFTRTERFRRVILTRGSISLTREAGRIAVKNLLLESEGLMRVEGNCSIANEQIDGVFQVGVTAASLQWLPGSQARVFTIAHDGYFWTPLRLTGPVAHPHEDLTPRLAAAAADELLQNSEDAVRDTARTLLDLIPH